MARNGSGTMAIPNTLVPGTTITASDLNENFDDIKDELTNSVAVDGQSTMTAPLKLSNGTAALPSMAFGSDTNTGIYRIGADNIGISIGGTKLVDISSVGLFSQGLTTTYGYYLQMGVTTVAALPAASASNKGTMTMVSDATATTFWSVAAGLGANIIRVTSDGTNWRIG